MIYREYEVLLFYTQMNKQSTLNTSFLNKAVVLLCKASSLRKLIILLPFVG